VRIIKTGILLFLIIKGTMGFSLGSAMESKSCCDAIQIEEVTTLESDSDTPVQKESSDHEKGCCDLNCECLCCIHLFTNGTETNARVNSVKIFGDNNSSYNFSYKHLLHKNIWQPPRLS